MSVQTTIGDQQVWAPSGAAPMYVPPGDDRKPSICPLCLGEGMIPDSAYAGSTAQGTKKTCHACDGKGITWPPKYT